MRWEVPSAVDCLGAISATSGDILDMQQLFDTHGAFIARAIERLTGGGSHVDDLLQETFIVAFRKSDRFDRARADVAPWLYGIAANLCRRFGRSRRRLEQFVNRFTPYAEMQGQSEGPERTMIREEEIKTVRRAISKLPFKQREVFVLFELEGMEGRDIGTLLNLKEGTVWTRLHHARKSFVTTVSKMVSVDD
jgi:RNA polymerase sigma-70 factor (ECF subfamily)